MVPLVDPVLTTATFSCDPCTLETSALRLVDSETARTTIQNAPGGEAKLRAHVAQPGVKLMLFIAGVVRAIPLSLILVTLALSLVNLAATGFSGASIRWLRRSALAAIVWTLALPLSMSIRWTALSSITHGREMRHIVLDTDEFLIGVLVSAGAWVLVWALEEANALQRDLEEYV